jgi:hypothetical protein
MRWEDESYVKLYVRDTPTWKAMNWQARALWPLLMRKLDKAGLLECGSLGRAAVSLMVELPEEVVSPGLASLERLGVIEWHDTTLEAPKFEEAQEAKKTELLKKRDQRQRARDMARAEGLKRRTQPPSEPPEIIQGVSPGVPECPKVSPVVPLQTPQTPQPSPDTPAQDLSSKKPDEEIEAEDDDEGNDLPLLTPEESRKTSGIDEVIRHYLEAMRANGKTPKPTKKRRKLVEQRIRDGIPIRDLKLAIDGLTWSDWHMGRDPRTNGAAYTDLRYCLKDPETVEAFIERVPPKHREAS